MDGVQFHFLFFLFLFFFLTCLHKEKIQTSNFHIWRGRCTDVLAPLACLLVKETGYDNHRKQLER
jgi:hypothetical protein